MLIWQFIITYTQGFVALGVGKKKKMSHEALQSVQADTSREQLGGFNRGQQKMLNAREALKLEIISPSGEMRSSIQSLIN